MTGTGWAWGIWPIPLPRGPSDSWLSSRTSGSSPAKSIRRFPRSVIQNCWSFLAKSMGWFPRPVFQNFWLFSSQIYGDISKVSIRFILQNFWLFSSQIYGEISKVSIRFILQNFWLFSSQIYGECGDIRLILRLLGLEFKHSILYSSPYSPLII